MILFLNWPVKASQNLSRIFRTFMYVLVYEGQQNTHDTHELYAQIHEINYMSFVPKTGVQLNIQEALYTLLIYPFI